MAKPTYHPRPALSRADQFPAVEQMMADDYASILIGRVVRAWGLMEMELHGRITQLEIASRRANRTLENIFPETQGVANTIERRQNQLRRLCSECGGESTPLYRELESALGTFNSLAEKRHNLSHGSTHVEEETDGTLSVVANNGRAIDDYVKRMSKVHDRMRKSGDNRRWRKELRRGHQMRLTFEELAHLEADLYNLKDRLRDIGYKIDHELTQKWLRGPFGPGNPNTRDP